MLKLTSYLIIFLLISCSDYQLINFKPRVIEKHQTTFGFDFSKYANLGFLFTPLEYSGKYKSIGILTFEALPSTQEKIDTIKLVDSLVTSNLFLKNRNSKKVTLIKTYWEVDTLKTDDVIEYVYTTAKKMGADAVTLFKIELIQKVINPISEEYTDRKMITYLEADGVTLEGYRVTGFAIKRD